MHDQTAVKTQGIEELLGQHPTVKARVDTGYRGHLGRREAYPETYLSRTKS